MSYYTFSSKIIFALFSLYLVVDSINGFMLREGLPSVSMPYKLMLIFLSCALFSLYLKLISISIFILAFLLYGTINFGFFQSFQGIDWLIKFLSIIYFYFYFKKFFMSDRGGYKNFLILYSVCFFILSFNVCLGLFGIGYSSYASSGLGSKGFIYAGNELGFAIILSASVLLAKLIHDRRFKLYCFISLLLIFVSALSAVKVAFVSSFLIVLLFPFLSMYRKSNFFYVDKRSFFFVFILYVFSPVVIFYAVYYLLFNVGLWERIEYFWGRTSLIDFILSGRYERLVSAINIYVYDYSFAEKMFGRSISWIDDIKVFNNVEIDFFDFLMRYGLFGLAFCLSFIFSGIYIALRSRHHQKKYYFIILSLGLLVSLTAGHVIYSGTASILISAFFAQLRVGGSDENTRFV